MDSLKTNTLLAVKVSTKRANQPSNTTANQAIGTSFYTFCLYLTCNITW